MTTTEYESDSFGRLKLVIPPSTDEVEYTLDWKGRRVEKYDSAVLTKRYIYESDLKFAAEIDISSGNLSEFIYSDVSTSPEYMIKGSTKYRYVKDQLGSIRLVVNAATGAIIQRMDYNEWGKVLADTNSAFQPFGFAGGLYDSQTGLVRFGARDYDPEVGRWTSKDPILFAGGDTSLYGYVLNDPVNFIDPEGRSALAAFLLGPVVFEVAFDATTYIQTYRETGSFKTAWETTKERSPLNNLTGVGVDAVLGPIAPVFQPLLDPSLMDTLIKVKNHNKKLEETCSPKK